MDNDDRDWLAVLEQETWDRIRDTMWWPRDEYRPVLLSTDNSWFPTYRWSITRAALKIVICDEHGIHCDQRDHIESVDW